MNKLKIFSFFLLFAFLANNLFADENSITVGINGSFNVMAHKVPVSGSPSYGLGTGYIIGKYLDSYNSIVYYDRAIFDFNLSSIPSNATITAASLSYSCIANDNSTSHKFGITQYVYASNFQDAWNNIVSSPALFSNLSYGSGNINNTSLTQLVSTDKGSKLYLGVFASDEANYGAAATMSLKLDITYTLPPTNATITATNNFSTSTGTNGQIIVDGGTFDAPHPFTKATGQSATLTAVSSQTDAQGYQRVWASNSKWSKTNSQAVDIPLNANTSSSYNITSITSSDNGATYTANLKKVCNLSFQGSLNGTTAPAKISFNGTQYDLPVTLQAVEGSDNTVQGVTQALNSVSFELTSWSDGGALAKTINPSQHQSYTATFKGYPLWSYALRNLNSPNMTDGTAVNFSWNEHSNSNVGYRVNVKGTLDNSNPYSYCYGTYPHGTTTFRDPVMVWNKGGACLLQYNVQPVYLPDNTLIKDEMTWFDPLPAELQKKTANINKDGIITEYAVANYPNPFNPTTVVNYQVPQAGRVTLKVYDIMGREIATLVDENKESGSYNVNFSMDKYRLSSGVYFCRMIAGKTMITNKMILSK
jgi:hypothetical protein